MLGRHHCFDLAAATEMQNQLSEINVQREKNPNKSVFPLLTTPTRDAKALAQLAVLVGVDLGHNHAVLQHWVTLWSIRAERVLTCAHKHAVLQQRVTL